MKLINIDGELYLDRKVKVFFSDQDIPEEFLDPTLYYLVIVNRKGYIERLGEKLYSDRGIESNTYCFEKST
jgi:hypothetical protein